MTDHRCARATLLSRRRCRWSLCALALSAATATAALGERATAEGLELASDTTYTLDPAATVVHVECTLTLTNTVPDRVEGNVVRQTYYSGFSLPAPVGITEVRAVSAGTPLRTTTRLDPTGRFTVIEVELARRLFSGEHATVTVSYDITGSPPRSADPTRVNPAYAAFLAWGVGSPGQVAVRVVVPEGFEVETLGAETERTSGLGVEVFAATEIADPERFALFVSARNDDALAVRTLTVGDARFEIRSWPGDDEWAAFTARLVAEGVPLLAELIGLPWPVKGTVQVREAYTPYLYGYAGWFDTAAREIEVGEDLDAEVVLHELSHAWFNRALFAERWLNEGFAQVVAAQAVAALGGAASDAHPPAADQSGAFALNEWQSPALEAQTDEVAARERYGYEASRWVIDVIADEVGWDAMVAVIEAAARRTIAYVGDAAPEVDGTVVDWRRFLDLVTERAGSNRAEQVLREWVVTPAQAAQLDARAQARRAYASLRAAGDGWAPPLGVRRAMGAWSFTEATALIDDAEDALATRDRLLEVATTLGLTPAAALEERYESAEGDLDAVQRELDELLASVERIAAATAAMAADRSLLAQIGLWGDDLAGRLSAARAAFQGGDPATATRLADHVLGALSNARERGHQRVTIAAVVMAALFALATVLVTRRRRQLRATSSDQLSASH